MRFLLLSILFYAMLGVASVSLVGGSVGQDSVKGAPPNRPSATSKGKPRRSEFKLLMMSNGSTKSGAPFGQRTYERLPGEKVYDMTVYFRSTDGAKKEFATFVENPIKTAVRETVVGKDGVKEERAVLTIKGRDCEEITTILWTSGNHLRQILSCSPEAAKEFEEEILRNGKASSP